MPVDVLDVNSLDAALWPGALPGELLAGKYRVERVLGRGGMGVVVLARNVRLGQHVAIKFLGRERTGELATRLLHEARAAARLSSDHVVRVFDVAELDDGAPYIVMEYLEGECLDQVLRRAGPIPWPDAVRWVLEACEGLALAHHHAIVHRDLKPANLFLERRPDGSSRIKVLDFGVAKLGEGLGNTTHPVGSPSYMAPEQLDSCRDIDARTDIWGMGIVLYELVTGATPYRASSLLGLALQVREAAHVPAHERCAELPRGLSDVIERCLRKRRDERFDSVRQLVAALCAFGPTETSGISSRVERLAAADSKASAASFAASEDGARSDQQSDEQALSTAALPARGELQSSARSRNIPGLATTLAEPAPRRRESRLATLAAVAAVGVTVAAAAAWHSERADSLRHGGGSAGGAAESALQPLLPAAHAATPSDASAALQHVLGAAAPSVPTAPVPAAPSVPAALAAPAPAPTPPRAPRAASSPVSMSQRAPAASKASARTRASSSAGITDHARAAPSDRPPGAVPGAPAITHPAAASVPTAVPAVERAATIPVGPLPLDRELAW